LLNKSIDLVLSGDTPCHKYIFKYIQANNGDIMCNLRSHMITDMVIFIPLLVLSISTVTVWSGMTLGRPYKSCSHVVRSVLDCVMLCLFERIKIDR